jgi:hypothetical protein
MELYKLVYICHPYSNDPTGNTEKVHQITADIYEQNIEILNGKRDGFLVIPLSSFVNLPMVMCEPSVSRDIAMGLCLKMLSACDEVWLYVGEDGEMSAGMREEYLFAVENNIRVIWR